MKVLIRLESIDHPRFNEFSKIRNELEKCIRELVLKKDYGGASIENEFHTVVRIYPKKRFIEFPEVYKPVAQINKKKKSVIITFDIYLEEIQSQPQTMVYEMLKGGVENSINKLSDLNVNDVDRDGLLNDIKLLCYK